MNSTISRRRTVFKASAGRLRSAAWLAALLLLAAAHLSPLRAADVPSDDAQDVLIRGALVTFNDANMTGNYAVLLAKSSRQFQAQFTAEKLFDAFRPFREKELFFEDVVTDEYESYENARIDSDGGLVLAGVFKGDRMRVKYRLRFVQDGPAWKILGINVDATRL